MLCYFIKLCFFPLFLDRFQVLNVRLRGHSKSYVESFWGKNLFWTSYDCNKFVYSNKRFFCPKMAFISSGQFRISGPISSQRIPIIPYRVQLETRIFERTSWKTMLQKVFFFRVNSSFKMYLRVSNRGALLSIRSINSNMKFMLNSTVT